jgi:hypothetical protein
MSFAPELLALLRVEVMEEELLRSLLAPLPFLRSR